MLKATLVDVHKWKVTHWIGENVLCKRVGFITEWPWKQGGRERRQQQLVWGHHIAPWDVSARILKAPQTWPLSSPQQQGSLFSWSLRFRISQDHNEVNPASGTQPDQKTLHMFGLSSIQKLWEVEWLSAKPVVNNLCSTGPRYMCQTWCQIKVVISACTKIYIPLFPACSMPNWSL